MVGSAIETEIEGDERTKDEGESQHQYFVEQTIVCCRERAREEPGF